MSQTENPETNSDERIRKIYVKDLKLGEVVHTVFRAARKEKLTTRGGKTYLALSLVDRTGETDGRVFDNVEAADQAFSADDYLLVKGKIGHFHGKSQIVVDRLERLDPGPIEAAEFVWVAPPVREEKPAATAGKEREEFQARARVSKRLERLLENPHVVQALDNFISHLEKAFDAHRASLPPRAEGAPAIERPDRPPRRARGPKVEHKPRAEGETAAPVKHEPKRDPSLPEGLAFKPFNALVASDAPAAEAEKSETPTT